MSANSIAAQSSNLGTDSLLRGATLDLGQSSLVVIFHAHQWIGDIYKLHRLLYFHQRNHESQIFLTFIR